MPSQADDLCFVLALPRYPVDPAWPMAAGETWSEVPDGSDLVVLDPPTDESQWRDAFADARIPGVHDPAQDPACYRLSREACCSLIGPVGTRTVADGDILAQLTPYAFIPPWPDLEDRARQACDRQDDLDLIEGMLDLRKALVFAAVTRLSARQSLNAYRARLVPQIDALQSRILTAWGVSLPPPATEDATAIRRERLALAVAAADARPGPIIAIAIDEDAPIQRVTPDEAAYGAALTPLRTGGLGLIAPVDQGLLDARLDEAIAEFVAALRRGHTESRRDAERITAVSEWIARNIDHVVTAAIQCLRDQPESAVLRQMKAVGLHYRTKPGTCEILSPAQPEGDELAYLALLGEARPAEAILGLQDPRQWPYLLDHVALLPIHERIPRRVLAPGLAKMTFSGATDIRLARRPGLVGRTRFEALCLGEQHTLTVPVSPDETSPFSALRPGQVIRVTASQPGQTQGLAPEEVAYDELDAMVTGLPRTVSVGRITEQTLAKLAHREGMKPEAYRTLLTGKGGAVVISLKVVSTRAITQEIEQERERGRNIQRQRQRQREIQRSLLMERGRGISR